MNFIHNIIQENGKTTRQNNLEINHNIPIGTLVEMKNWEIGEGGSCIKYHARLWVVEHRRDCDGTPLYVLSIYKDPSIALSVETLNIYCGYPEGSLIPISITKEVEQGIDVLEWDEDEDDF